ncbi:protein spalt-accessory-like [Fopius arisanus]|uniref:Protein spalt-accessory-like n=1 Tax=Fopius arisanus TaxID=64838 RepID=A0A9R1T626_9HYME|nr:PREDICTED: protein spalt-accessory-like [Fopius arisanus]
MSKLLVVIIAVVLVGALASPLGQQVEEPAEGVMSSRVQRSPDPVPDRHGGKYHNGGKYGHDHHDHHDHHKHKHH